MDSNDVAAKWGAVRCVYVVPITRDRNPTEYLANSNPRILIGTDTPAVPTSRVMGRAQKAVALEVRFKSIKRKRR